MPQARFVSQKLAAGRPPRRPLDAAGTCCKAAVGEQVAVDTVAAGTPTAATAAAVTADMRRCITLKCSVL